MSLRSSCIVAFVFAAGCRSGTEPLLHDIDVAHSRWLQAKPAAYTFDVAIATSWTPKSPYHTATVVDAVVTKVIDENGMPVPGSWAISIDSLWQRIITERQHGNLNSVVFSQAGVPLETDWGPWPVDGGIHYSVCNFARLR